MKRPRQRAPRNRIMPNTEKSVPVYWLDAPLDIEVINGVDDVNVVRKDPGDCVLQHAACRVFDCAEIGRGFSYFYATDAKGTFAIKAKTGGMAIRYLTAFDEGGHFPGGWYRFGRISPSGRKPRTSGRVRGSGGGNRPTINTEVRRALAA